MSDHLDLKQHHWLKAKAVTRIMDAVAASDGEARVVGGAVRDALLGEWLRPEGAQNETGINYETPHEIDFAVNLPPEKVKELLERTGIKCVPTGVEHGTVTAVVDHKGYEITTLRRDVETDGRRAKVAFTDDWQADAGRRDFTMNALYADRDGKLYDYFDGQKALKAGHVRFIGDAHARIKEDVLRILRFFRFYAWFGKGAPDKDALAACRELKGLIPQLSAERIWRETIKLLTAEKPVPAWKLMQETGVLDAALPEAKNVARLEALLKIEAKYEMPPSPLVRLAALLPQDKAAAEKFAARLKLSNREAEKIAVLAILPSLLRGKLDPIPFRRALYEYGADAGRDAALLAAADAPSLDLEPVLEIALTWERPTFPVTGGDLLKAGATPGPKLGEALKAAEEWWMAQDFRPSRDECLARARQRLGK